MLKSQTNPTSVILTPTNEEQAVLQILSDHVLFNRFYDGMYTILNAYEPDKTANELKVDYKGIDIALIIMNIKDENLIEKLHDTFYDLACDRKSDWISAPELAQTIYLKWLSEIKNYFLTKKVA